MCGQVAYQMDETTKRMSMALEGLLSEASRAKARASVLEAMAQEGSLEEGEEAPAFLGPVHVCKGEAASHCFRAPDAFGRDGTMRLE